MKLLYHILIWGSLYSNMSYTNNNENYSNNILVTISIVITTIFVLKQDLLRIFFFLVMKHFLTKIISSIARFIHPIFSPR